MGAGIIAGVGALAAAGTSAYSASQQSKAAGATGKINWDAVHKLGSLDLGSVPQAAMYNPVNFTKQQLDAITGNQQNLGSIYDLMSAANTGTTADSMKQANSMIPGYSASMAQMGANANSLLHGQLPVNDLQSLVTKQGEDANALNIPGLAGNATLRDLGMSQMDAMQTGSGMLGNMVNMANQLNPQSNRITAGQMMINPQQNITDAMGQNQLIQQSQQNAYNLAAAPDPNAQAQAQLIMGSALMPRLGQGVNYGAAASQAASGIGQIGNALLNSGSGSGNSGAPESQSVSGMYSSPSNLYSDYPTASNGQNAAILGNSNTGYYYGGYYQ